VPADAPAAETLLAYASTLAFYLSLRASPAHAARPARLRAHAVLARLLALKRVLVALDALDFAPDSDEESEGLSDGALEDAVHALAEERGLDADELAALLEDAGLGGDAEPAPRRKKARTEPAVGLDGLDLLHAEAEAEAEVASETKKAKKAKKAKVASIAEDLDVVAPTPKKKKATQSATVFDLVEPTA
jgi:hypothetical protein